MSVLWIHRRPLQNEDTIGHLAYRGVKKVTSSCFEVNLGKKIHESPSQSIKAGLGVAHLPVKASQLCEKHKTIVQASRV
jgi:hypothetical protein